MLQATLTGSLSLSALQQAPSRIIFNPEGLSAHPAERGHSRKLKKLFQEYKVPSWERRRRPILMCGDKVAAIADLFIDHHFIGQDCELIWSK
jgi:tRNA(Ile)-lysidine synthase